MSHLIEDPSSKKKIPFCGACSSGYTLDVNECSSCDHLQASSVLIIGVLGAGMVIGFLASLRLMLCSHHFKATALLLRLMWPRINQSAALIITNYQILSGLPSRLRIPFPDRITRLLKSFTAIINIDIINLRKVELDDSEMAGADVDIVADVVDELYMTDEEGAPPAVKR